MPEQPQKCSAQGGCLPWGTWGHPMGARGWCDPSGAVSHGMLQLPGDLWPCLARTLALWLVLKVHRWTK